MKTKYLILSGIIIIIISFLIVLLIIHLRSSSIIAPSKTSNSSLSASKHLSPISSSVKNNSKSSISSPAKKIKKRLDKRKLFEPTSYRNETERQVLLYANIIKRTTDTDFHRFTARSPFAMSQSDQAINTFANAPQYSIAILKDIIDTDARDKRRSFALRALNITLLRVKQGNNNPADYFPDYENYLFSLLKDESPNIRINAAIGIGWLELDSWKKIIREMIQNDPSEKVRMLLKKNFSKKLGQN